MKKFVYIFSVIALIAVIIIVLISNKKSTQEKSMLASKISTSVSVQVDIVRETPINLSFSSNGTLDPVRELAFMSDVAGRVVSVFVDEGTRISAGQKLIQVDDEMLRADFVASEAAYNALKTDLDRFTNANKEGGVTDQQMETIRTQYVAAESRYISSRRRLADAGIKAPFSGTIIKRYVEVGAYLNPGARLFDIIDDSQLRVMCNVTEKQVLNVSEGQKVRIMCGTFPGETYPGTVTFAGTRADRSINYPVEITISERDKKLLKAGMYATVYFDAAAEKQGIQVPRSAISGSVKDAIVYTVENGTASARSVVVGAMMDKYVEILSGIEAGDSIIVAGLINVNDGMKVRSKK